MREQAGYLAILPHCTYFTHIRGGEGVWLCVENGVAPRGAFQYTEDQPSSQQKQFMWHNSGGSYGKKVGVSYAILSVKIHVF